MTATIGHPDCIEGERSKKIGEFENEESHLGSYTQLGTKDQVRPLFLGRLMGFGNPLLCEVSYGYLLESNTHCLIQFDIPA